MLTEKSTFHCPEAYRDKERKTFPNKQKVIISLFIALSNFGHYSVPKAKIDRKSAGEPVVSETMRTRSDFAISVIFMGAVFP